MKYIFLFIAIPFLLFSKSATHIVVEGMIDNGLPLYIQRAIEKANENNSDYLIVEVNTFGGRVDSATKIKDLLIDCEIPTIAFVNKRAISAGSLITLSCDSIFMSEGSSMGATTVVDDSGEKQSEKAQSYMRAEMGSTAEKSGRNRLIAEAMVDEDVEIDSLIGKGKLLTLTSEMALKYKMCDYIIADFDDLLSHYDIDSNKVYKVEISISESLVRFLTHPIMSSLLMTIAFLGLIFEMKTAGWGVGGTVGIIALSLFFGAQYIVNLADNIELIILMVSMVLILLEVFVIPGFGIAGITGITGLLTSLFMMLIGDFASKDDYISAGNILSISLITTIVGTFLLFKFLPGFKLFDFMVVKKAERSGSGIMNKEIYLDLLNKEGYAVTDLKLSGNANIDGETYQVISMSEFLVKDTEIIVSKVEGNKVFVKRK
ncbi:MAG: nodulation protein NfeD [Candidatus Delongbacteria bacterium]|nr:nodulation protein NfeD [Candidatus Delongbacteria bacterium]MBN2835925.1 nodulation protein NfeD [Candidatus Delongbacteria bacterium]